MPKTWPPKPGFSTLTIELRSELIQHLDAQADLNGMSRSAYIRQIIIRDRRRQGPGRLPAQG